MKMILFLASALLSGCASVFDLPPGSILQGPGWACTSTDIRVCNAIMAQRRDLASPAMQDAIEDAKKGAPAGAYEHP